MREIQPPSEQPNDFASSPEQGNDSETLTPLALHRTLSETLLGLNADKWGPDAYYYLGTTQYTDDAGNAVFTHYSVDDYHDYESTEWAATHPYGGDPVEQRRMLATGHSIIGIQHNEPGRPYYSVLWPKETQREPYILELYRDPNFPDVPPTVKRPDGWPEAPDEWPVEGPVVIESGHYIIDPNENPFLQAVYRDLHEQE